MSSRRLLAALRRFALKSLGGFRTTPQNPHRVTRLVELELQDRDGPKLRLKIDRHAVSFKSFLSSKLWIGRPAKVSEQYDASPHDLWHRTQVPIYEHSILAATRQCQTYLDPV